MSHKNLYYLLVLLVLPLTTAFNFEEGVYGLRDDYVIPSTTTTNVTTGGNGTGKIGNPPYLYNDTLTMFFNETRLNLTIDDRASGLGDNESWNESYADTLYYDISNPLNFINTSSGGGNPFDQSLNKSDDVIHSNFTVYREGPTSGITIGTDGGYSLFEYIEVIDSLYIKEIFMLLIDNLLVYENLWVLGMINSSTNVTATEFCNSSGDCWSSQGEGGGNGTFNQSLTDEKYVPYTGANANLDMGPYNLTSSFISGNTTTPITSNNLVNKEYVDNIASAIAFDFFFTNFTSDISGHHNLTESDVNLPESSLTTGSLSTGDNIIFNFTTEIGQPEFNELRKGVYDARLHLFKTGTKSVTITPKLYNISSDGSIKTLLVTFETSIELTTIDATYDLHGTLNEEIILSPSDRLHMEFVATVGSSGSAPTVTIDMEGTTDTHFSIETSSNAFEQIFLRQDGTKNLTGDWDFGSYNIEGEGNITATKFCNSSGDCWSSQGTGGSGDNESWSQAKADTLYAILNYGDEWNKTYADTLYYDISNPNNYVNTSSGDNESWNESFAKTLFAGIEWDYNQSLATYEMWNADWISTYNTTYDAKVTDNTTWSQAKGDTLYYSINNPNNYINTSGGDNSSWNESYANTLYAILGYGDEWNKTYADTLYAILGYGDNWNKTYGDTLYYGISNPNNYINTSSGDNESWNESFARTLFAGIEWDYNQSLATYGMWNDIWVSTFNATYDAKVTDNESWSQAKGDTLYYNLSNPNNYVNTSDGINESYAKSLFAPNTTLGIQYLINGTIDNRGVVNSWNSTYNATYDAKRDSDNNTFIDELILQSNTFNKLQLNGTGDGWNYNSLEFINKLERTVWQMVNRNQSGFNDYFMWQYYDGSSWDKKMEITPEGNLNVSENISAQYFTGDGSLLDNIPTYNETYDELINQTCGGADYVQATNTSGGFVCSNPLGDFSLYRWLTFRDDDNDNVDANSPSDIFSFISGNGIKADIRGDGIEINMTGEIEGDFNITGDLNRNVTLDVTSNTFGTLYTNNNDFALDVYGSVNLYVSDIVGHDVAYARVYVDNVFQQQIGMNILYSAVTNTIINISDSYNFVVPIGSTYQINSTTSGIAQAHLISLIEVEH